MNEREKRNLCAGQSRGLPTSIGQPREGGGSPTHVYPPHVGKFACTTSTKCCAVSAQVVLLLKNKIKAFSGQGQNKVLKYNRRGAMQVNPSEMLGMLASTPH